MEVPLASNRQTIWMLFYSLQCTGNHHHTESYPAQYVHEAKPEKPCFTGTLQTSIEKRLQFLCSLFLRWYLDVEESFCGHRECHDWSECGPMDCPLGPHQPLRFDRRRWHPTPVLLPGKSHGCRNLVAAVHGVSEGQTWLSDFTYTFHFHALEKEMATHSSVLAWRIPGKEEPCGLPSMGSHRVGHNWSDLAAAAGSQWHTLMRMLQQHPVGLLTWPHLSSCWYGYS